jgi:hypothetical protein
MSAGTHDRGFRFSDERIKKAEIALGFIGDIVVTLIIMGAVVMIGSAIVGMVINGADAPDVGIFGPLTFIGMFGGIALPVLVFAVGGIFYAAWFGGQAISKYGWVVSMPFAVWFFAGLVICNVWGIDSALEGLLDMLDIVVDVPQLLPWWAYVVGLAVFVGAWFVLDRVVKRSVPVDPKQQGAVDQLSSSTYSQT